MGSANFYSLVTLAKSTSNGHRFLAQVNTLFFEAIFVMGIIFMDIFFMGIFLQSVNIIYIFWLLRCYTLR